jgi:hypothetical protein
MRARDRDSVRAGSRGEYFLAAGNKASRESSPASPSFLTAICNSRVSGSTPSARRIVASTSLHRVSHHNDAAPQLLCHARSI